MAPSTFARTTKQRSPVRSRVVRRGLGTAALSAALVAALWPGTALAAPKHPISYFNPHPCALFSDAQASAAIHSQISHTTAAPNAQYGGACLYGARGKPNVDLSFAPGTISSLKVIFPGKSQSESSVAPGAVCIVVSASYLKQSHAVDPANFLVSVPGGFVVDMSTAKCAQAVPLAKIALSEVS